MRSCFAALMKSGSQSPESSRTNPETTGSPITLCPAVQKKSEWLLLIKTQNH